MYKTSYRRDKNCIVTRSFRVDEHCLPWIWCGDQCLALWYPFSSFPPQNHLGPGHDHRHLGSILQRHQWPHQIWAQLWAGHSPDSSPSPCPLWMWLWCCGPLERNQAFALCSMWDWGHTLNQAYGFYHKWSHVTLAKQVRGDWKPWANLHALAGICWNPKPKVVTQSFGNWVR